MSRSQVLSPIAGVYNFVYEITADPPYAMPVDPRPDHHQFGSPSEQRLIIHGECHLCGEVGAYDDSLSIDPETDNFFICEECLNE